MEQAATISFMPPGGTADDQECSWQIRCLGPNEGVHINFQRFQTEELYDFVWIDDGSIDDATCEQGGRELPDGCLAIMSGELRDQTAREFRSSGDELLIRFRSDSSIGGEGFETSY